MRNSSSSISSQLSTSPRLITVADLYCDSDDDDDDEEEVPEEEGEERVKKEGEVKAEPGTSKKKTKDLNELRVYVEDELMQFKPNQLLADVQLLDGACVLA